MMKQIKISDFYKLQESILSLFGLWPGCDKKKWKLFYKFQKWITSYCLSFGFLVSLSMDMYLRSGSIEQLADASYYFATQISFIIKLSCFRWRYKEFKYLITENLELLNGDKYSCRPWLQISNFIAQSFLFVCYLTSAFYCIRPFVDEETLLPMGGWFPWEVKGSSFGRAAAYIFQSLGLIIGVAVNGDLDTLVISLLCAGCWQIRLLKDNLSRISRQDHPDLVNKQLIGCIEHHLAIIRYVELVEDVFTNGLFCQFITSGSGLCITGFQVIVTPVGSGKFYTMLIYLVALMMQISIYCWAGQQLITESNDISTSCYNMDWWYGCICQKKTKIALFLMMERCRRPLSLRAGRFFNLSVLTLATILRTSYSFFAVLQRMYTNKNI